MTGIIDKRKQVKVSILHYDGINQTPGVPLIAMMWNEMLKKGFVSNETVGGWDNQLLVASAYGKDIGILGYEHVKWRKIIWISMAYVMPVYRERGVYRQLFEELKRRSRSMEGRPVEIQGGISVKNEAMLKTAVSQNRKAICVIYSYDLKKDKK